MILSDMARILSSEPIFQFAWQADYQVQCLKKFRYIFLVVIMIIPLPRFAAFDSTKKMRNTHFSNPESA